VAFRSFVHNLKHLARLETAETQTTQRERDAIARYARGKLRVVEIGVFEGVNTAVLARAIDPRGELFAIDPNFPGRLGVCWGELVARREVQRSGAAERVRFVTALSTQAATQLQGTFDCVFVDGDHSRPGVEADWRDWSPRVRSEGLILMHDTHVPAHNPAVAHYGSHLYFEEAIRHDPRFRIVEVVDSMTVLQRRAATD
jgi:predicted O-methyltransferase YrrM